MASSALMQAMITNPHYGPPNPGTGMRYDDFAKIGDLALTQLAGLRHRGAFSTVSQTFAACCIRCGSSKDPTLADLTNTWYQVRAPCAVLSDLLNNNRKRFLSFTKKLLRLRGDQPVFLQ